MSTIFINRNSQLRSGWKIIITLVTFLCFFWVLTSIIEVFYTLMTSKTGLVGFDPQGFSNTLSKNLGLQFIMAIAQAASIFLAVLGSWRRFDRKPLKDLGLTNPFSSLKNLVAGFLVGAVSISLIFLALLWTGQVSIKNGLSNPSFSWAILLGLLLFIIGAVAEELFLRGYCITVLRQTGSTRVMILVSSVIYSLMYGMITDITMISFLNIFFIGVLLALMYIKTGNLWMPIGFNLTWSFFQTGIFGFGASSAKFPGLYQLKMTGASFLNGGKTGVEGSILATVILVAGVFYLSISTASKSPSRGKNRL